MSERVKKGIWKELTGKKKYGDKKWEWGNEKREGMKEIEWESEGD